jgi:hypothetical protein
VGAQHGGADALLTTATGDIYRYEGATGALTLVAEAMAGPLHAVAFGHDGSTAVAVGEGGAMLVSTDGGRRWRDRPSGTTRTLRDVWLIGADGGELMAVGDGGVLVEGMTVAGDGATPRSLGEGYTLRSLHMESSGHGTIVGDRGVVLSTRDFGASWTRIDTGDTRDIFAVDALGSGTDHL